VRLSLYEFGTGVETIGGNRVVYDVTADEAWFGAASVDGHALVWQLDHDAEDAEGALVSRAVELDPFADWIVRCDRVDFPKGGVAYLHTHPGPGIRYLLRGELEITTEGRSTFYGPGGAWFERGPDPVRADASPHLETSFVRVMVLPAEWTGKRTIRYVDPADDDLPKLQRASILFDHPFAVPR
jgi:quercetin dioxygenase-like cupin family protein